MPKRDDIKKIMLIGSGPIIIGQACEFDYSGTQACKALREEGYEVVLVNSNPATIMTDPEFADRTYIEPLTCDILHEIIRRERPDAILPTLGGQTALNLAMELADCSAPHLNRVFYGIIPVDRISPGVLLVPGERWILHRQRPKEAVPIQMNGLQHLPPGS